MTMFWWDRNHVFTHENAIPQNSDDFFLKFVYIRLISLVTLSCMNQPNILKSDNGTPVQYVSTKHINKWEKIVSFQ